MSEPPTLSETASNSHQTKVVYTMNDNITDKAYQLLFEPLQIGPVTTKNRFFQVPHCTGMGTLYPHHTAKFREMKAEGGWGVVCTELCGVDPHTDVSPFSFEKIWSDEDIPGLQLMVDAVHKHGALAGIELVHEGSSASNKMSRYKAQSPSARPARNSPTQGRALDRAEIREMRESHKRAALRAKKAGFDIIYVYASHTLSILTDFLSERVNRRDDDYGGILENRVRLLREVLSDTKDAVGDTCAVALRFGVDEVMGDAGYTCRDDGRRVVEMLADIPDLWDVNVNNLDFDMMTSRFTEEGYQEPFTSFVKSVTNKPVVGVGRYTSPDRMVSLIKKGALDLIGAARPSIADPFLPNKIKENRIEDIRECIGCNMCLSMQYSGGPIRCTQNPTTGEEWRRGWHPERIQPKRDTSNVLVIGAGPAGLEASLTLGKRGYDVTLAEARDEFGGRVAQESRLPGLQAWSRVRDYRTYQISQMPNVSAFMESRMTVEDVLDADFDDIVIATGSTWQKDGIGRCLRKPFTGWQGPAVYTPDDIFAGAQLQGPVVIYDDDSYYMGGVIAEKLVKDGHDVTLMTPETEVSGMLRYTGELQTVQAQMHKLGINIAADRQVVAFDGTSLTSSCVFTSREHVQEAGALVVISMRAPDEALYKEFMERQSDWASFGVKSVTPIGDCFAPGTIAEAVYAGHKFAREFHEVKPQTGDFLIERMQLRESV